MATPLPPDGQTILTSRSRTREELTSGATKGTVAPQSGPKTCPVPTSARSDRRMSLQETSVMFRGKPTTRMSIPVEPCARLRPFQNPRTRGLQ